MATTRWQYDVQTIGARGLLRPKIPADELLQLLNERGAMGWELVQIVPPVMDGKMGTTHTLVFKREQ